MNKIDIAIPLEVVIGLIAISALVLSVGNQDNEVNLSGIEDKLDFLYEKHLEQKDINTANADAWETQWIYNEINTEMWEYQIELNDLLIALI